MILNANPYKAAAAAYRAYRSIASGSIPHRKGDARRSATSTPPAPSPLRGGLGEGGEAGTRFPSPLPNLPVEGRGPEEQELFALYSAAFQAGDEAPALT
jgi:hypothetical protein